MRKIQHRLGQGFYSYVLGLRTIQFTTIYSHRISRKSMKKRRLSRRFSPADKEALHASAAEISQCLKLLTQNVRSFLNPLSVFNRVVCALRRYLSKILAQKINEKNCFDLPLSSLLHETKQDAEFERASVLLETASVTGEC